MKIQVKAKLILTVPCSQEEQERDEVLLLAAEQYINEKAAVLIMPVTKTKVGIRIHVG